MLFLKNFSRPNRKLMVFLPLNHTTGHTGLLNMCCIVQDEPTMLLQVILLEEKDESATESFDPLVGRYHHESLGLVLFMCCLIVGHFSVSSNMRNHN